MTTTTTLSESAGTGDPATDAAAPAGAIRILALDHVVLRVRDHGRAIRFYEDVLGCRVERRLETPKLVQLRAGAALIDLVEVPAEASPPEAADRGANMDHFAVRIDGFDAGALAAHLRRHGVAFGEVRDRYGAEGTGPSLYIHDPDGNMVELKGPPHRA